MQTGGIADFAVQGETGIDVFRRIDEAAQRRSRFECLATVVATAADDAAPRVIAHGPPARRDPDAMLATVTRFRACTIAPHRMALGDARSFPDTGFAEDPLAVFVYLDFLRAWMTADMAVQRFEEETLRADAPDPARADPARTAAVLRLLLDFNRVARGVALCEPVLPALIRAAEAPRAAADRRADVRAYGLRLAGDLLLRAGQGARALRAFEAALSLGDNRFRRRRAIEAARAAADHDAMRHHLDLFARRWALPGDLALLRASLGSPGAAIAGGTP